MAYISAQRVLYQSFRNMPQRVYGLYHDRRVLCIDDFKERLLTLAVFCISACRAWHETTSHPTASFDQTTEVSGYIIYRAHIKYKI